MPVMLKIEVQHKVSQRLEQKKEVVYLWGHIYVFTERNKKEQLRMKVKKKK